MTDTTTAKLPSLTCTECGVLVPDVNATGGELRAWLMRWRGAHKRRGCDGKLTLQPEPQHVREPQPGLDRETKLVAKEIARLAGIVEQIVERGNLKPLAAANTARDLAKYAATLANLTQRAVELDAKAQA
jgi:hypothetical protein